MWRLTVVLFGKLAGTHWLRCHGGNNACRAPQETDSPETRVGLYFCLFFIFLTKPAKCPCIPDEYQKVAHCGHYCGLEGLTFFPTLRCGMNAISSDITNEDRIPTPPKKGSRPML
jgi:hypothetical protein